MIYILYATKVNIGGWATFTRHLADSLIAEGQEVELLKIGNNTESKSRPFGDMGHAYRNVSFTDMMILAKKNQFIIAALGKHYINEAAALMRRGARIVVHDTAESTNRMELPQSPWVIRKALRRAMPGSTFIRHPYVPQKPPAKPLVRKGLAVATSRVDFDKNTRMILDANRLGADIKIVGFENRLYTRFKICPDYPEWIQSPGTHPRTGVGSYYECLQHKFMVDLTDIKGDGGGTQYTFLEAWDAGAIPIIGEWWIQPNDDMKHGENCFAVSSAKDLVTAVKQRHDLAVVSAGKARLVKHSPAVIVPKILKWLES